MYAGSLVKIFEQDLGPAFQNKTGYTYTGEGRGSLQIANMILDGQEGQMFLSVQVQFLLTN
jgi:molybdate/tungstate transport system substrate-binding protein